MPLVSCRGKQSPTSSFFHPAMDRRNRDIERVGQCSSRLIGNRTKACERDCHGSIEGVRTLGRRRGSSGSKFDSDSVKPGCFAIFANRYDRIVDSLNRCVEAPAGRSCLSVVGDALSDLAGHVGGVRRCFEASGIHPTQYFACNDATPAHVKLNELEATAHTLSEPSPHVLIELGVRVLDPSTRLELETSPCHDHQCIPLEHQTSSVGVVDQITSVVLTARMASALPVVDGAEFEDLVEEARSAVAARRLRTDLPPPADRERIRRESGISARRCAVALGVTTSAFLKWEQGKATPEPSRAARYQRLLAALLDVIDSA